jgi:predicted dinucleotide-binding enzyme
MKIGIIGAGMIGGTTARLFAKAGHDVAVSNSRGPESLTTLVKDLGPNGRAMTVDDAAKWADVVLLAVPWRSPEALPDAASVKGKIVIDAMNPYTPDGSVADLGASSSSEETAKRLPGARIVKAFNTIWFKHLAELGRMDLPADDRHAVFIAGDDADAKRIVSDLIAAIGFGAVDTGRWRRAAGASSPTRPSTTR